MVARMAPKQYILDSYFNDAEHKGLHINTNTMVEAAKEAVQFLGIEVKESDKDDTYLVKYPGKKKFEELPAGSDFGANLEALYQFRKYVIRGVQKDA